jgi:hypothetical protein
MPRSVSVDTARRTQPDGGAEADAEGDGEMLGEGDGDGVGCGFGTRYFFSSRMVLSERML